MKSPIKFALIFFLVGLFLGIIYLSLPNVDALENAANDHLGAILNERVSLVNNFLYEQKRNAVEFSKTDVFRDFLENPDQRPVLLTEVNDAFFENINKDPFVDESFIVSPQGDILVNTQRGYTPPNIFKEFDYSTEEEGYAYIIPIRFCYCISGYVLDVITPLYSDKTGELIGLVAVRSYMSSFSDLAGDQLGLSDLERVYLVDEHGLLISSSVFFQERQKGFIQNADNENARKCFSLEEEGDYLSHEEFTNPFPNYLGREVLGIHKYFSEPRWCLLVEDDADELYNIPKRNIFLRDITITIVFAFVLCIIGYFFGKYLDKKRNKK